MTAYAVTGRRIRAVSTWSGDDAYRAMILSVMIVFGHLIRTQYGQSATRVR